MQIAVGHREKAPPLLAELHRRGLAIQRARLPLGDHLIKEHLLFKRKTIPDLLASLTDGRLFHQARQLYHWRARQPGRRSAFIIEGRIRPPGTPFCAVLDIHVDSTWHQDIRASCFCRDDVEISGGIRNVRNQQPPI